MEDPDESGTESAIGTPPSPSRLERFLLFVVLLCSVCTGTAMGAVLILPLGDSITHGSDAYPSYRPLLYQDLRTLGYDIDFVGSSHTPALATGLDPDNDGHPGYTAGMVLAELPAWLGTYPPPAIALVHLGTNDAIQYVPRDRTIADITSIIGLLRARNPTMTILLAQIIPTSVASTNTRIEALNREIAALQSLSTPQSPIVIVDQYSGYNGQADNQAGGVHPLTSGEKKMTSRWKAALIPVLDGAAPPEQPRYGPHTLPGRIEAENYDIGGYVDTSPGNAGNAYRDDDVDIEYAPAEGSYAVGWIRDGESLSYTVNVTAGGPFICSARVASPYEGRAVVLAVNGTAAAAIPVPDTGSFEAYRTVSVEVALPAGEQRIALRFSGDGQNLNWLEFETASPVPTLTVPPLPPQDITDLANSTYDPTSITWTWADPVDPGFANVSVCLDGAPAGTVERGVRTFTAAGLAPSTPHTIGTRARSAAGTESATWTNHTAWTAPAPAPTATETPDVTPTSTVTPVSTVAETPDVTPTITPPAEETPAVTPAVTETPAPPPTESPNLTPTDTPTPTVTETLTSVPTEVSGPPPEPLLLPVPSAEERPGDPDGDGLYEDVNGNGRADFADIVLFFDRMGWCAENEPVAAFDYNANGRIDFADVTGLFARL